MPKKDYDYAQALYNTKQIKPGHLGSVDPHTGAFLKKEFHPTFKKGVEGERRVGNILGNIRGKLLSFPTKKKGFLKK